MKRVTAPPHIIKLTRRWGGLATDALLDPVCQYFQTSTIEGFIGYRVERRCAIVYGDPVCATENQVKLAQSFHDFCKDKYKNIIYVTASASFARSACQETICGVIIEYGEAIALDPQSNPSERTGTNGSLIRRKTRQAKDHGVTVVEYTSEDDHMEKQIEQVGVEWLNSRKGPQIHISNVHLFENRFGKRWFIAQKGGEIVGTVVLNQLESKQGWHLNHLMTNKSAPNGTPELLVISVLEILKKENCSYVSCGAAATKELGEITGLSTISSWVARRMFHFATKIFHLKGHKMFWGKFHPITAPSYLIFQKPRIGAWELAALMDALNVSLT